LVFEIGIDAGWSKYLQSSMLASIEATKGSLLVKLLLNTFEEVEVA